YGEDELRHVLAMTEPDLAISTPHGARLLRRANPELEVVTDVPALASDVPTNAGPPLGDGPSGEALILLTSGSTGPPKPLAITHDGFLDSIAKIAGAHSSRVRLGGPAPVADEQAPPNLVYWPLFHAGGINALMFAWFVGRSVLLIERFRAERVARLATEHAVDNLFLLPTMMYDLVDLPENVGLPTVRSV